ncbi:MAG: hypothetical protein KF773_39165 [Deltaproteobacteria bacterium]|nr:hypothetical protein [Deltaproteobacteria bacterium]MCW5805870.1 hypothetical protein [Deltaproteobacteria bacterium]
MRQSWCAIAAAALAACSSFESEEIVLDLRVIAMQASVPEQVVEVDLQNPPQPADLLPQLVPSEVCALVADPDRERRLRYQLRLCVDNRGRCDEGQPSLELASGFIDDPDTSLVAPRLCATVQPDANLLGILLAVLKLDALHGLGGLDYLVALRVGGEDEDPANDIFAGKTLRVSPKIPAARTANTNPSLDYLQIAIDEAEPIQLPFGRCLEQTAPVTVNAGARVRITPVESETARETYVVPTLDGNAETFTESLTYQWLADGGGFSKNETGGPRNRVTGNPAPLFTDFRAPSAKTVDVERHVKLWIVQRDERLGSQWYETCVRVVAGG